MAMNIYRWGTTQVVDFTSASTSVANAFGGQTRAVRLYTNSACNVKIGTGPQTAASTDPLVAVNGGFDYILVTPGQRLSAITASGGSLTSANGRLWVTEIL